MEAEHLTYFEKRIISELEEIEIKLKSLEHEKSALQRQLAKARAQRTGIQNVTRKNSVNRVLAENAITTALRDSKKALTTAELYRIALATNFDLKSATFRTYLHRMKKKNLIKTAKYVGTWELTNKS